MHHRHVAALLLLPLAFLAVAAPVLATSDPGTFAAETLRLVNVERRKRNLKALRRHPALESAAREIAERIAYEGPQIIAEQDAYQVRQRVERYGYRARRVAENYAIALNHPPQNVVRAWMGHPVTRGNILHPKLRETGVAGGFDPNGAIVLAQVFAQPGNPPKGQAPKIPFIRFFPITTRLFFHVDQHGQVSPEQEFGVQNIGNASTKIDVPRVTANGGPFQITQGSGIHLLRPQEIHKVRVRYAPPAPNVSHEDQIPVSALNDPFNASLYMGLSGTVGRAQPPKRPALRIFLDRGFVQFADTRVGAKPGRRQTFRVGNMGDQGTTLTVTVSQPQGGNGSYKVLQPLRPVQLTRGQSVEVIVEFSPVAAGHQLDHITIEGREDPFVPHLNVGLLGRGVP
jgi:uncharacterized protein YkwD